MPRESPPGDLELRLPRLDARALKSIETFVRGDETLRDLWNKIVTRDSFASVMMAGRRMAYFTSRSSSASYSSGLAKAASARNTTSLPSSCWRSISGSSSSSQPSALETLPGRSLAARQSPSRLNSTAGSPRASTPPT